MGLQFTGNNTPEINEVIPGVVSANTDGMMGINYPVLTAVLIESIKDLTAKITLQKSFSS